MAYLKHKRILLGITGGIAAYKSADLVRRLREQGADVRVVMTRSACEFITPLTMQALSGRPVHTELLDYSAEAAMGHIELARWCDVVLIAPASANFMARLTHGQADDLLSTLCLAASVPLLLAPAMNQQMWLNPATQDNARLLTSRGITLLGPADGSQACGDTGPGRMLEPGDLIGHLDHVFQTNTLTAKKLVITAGPTREDIDPVRFISNRSSGRMGYAVARAAVEAGAEVVLISGPTSLELPERVFCQQVVTARQMHDAVMNEIRDTDIFIAAAAVADYRCSTIADQKIKKTDAFINLTLEKNPDILGEVASLSPPPFTVGFAAETEALLENARKKLINKKLDMIAANLVGDNRGFESEDNELQIIWKDGNIKLDHAPKEKLARNLVAIIAKHIHEKNSAQTH
ncbi:MAG: phosphopantothenoylcysteine decarboxylase [Gammaproteobacteria bacterium RIFCSPLOWO2_02_FULL_47_50]|nr:MAG: phosphopantothenoylcysteine decarboxylase [Gammaproteobacteria bacterium RIFCSPLOWO2_12_47_11]OGT81471.1 MAG: phosphopantothenoylcysteine decarboxylase [Gammaproteobacteria bacterium RIFCSPLOWO2_02_FULL_47_50]OGT83456.1 MAG: phosphopantothenoylcysteine decarboxylase [Gammaproteobacteria bacterium RIFCSPLOWO2_12_FULL_47_76]